WEWKERDKRVSLSISCASFDILSVYRVLYLEYSHQIHLISTPVLHTVYSTRKPGKQKPNNTIQPPSPPPERTPYSVLRTTPKTVPQPTHHHPQKRGIPQSKPPICLQIQAPRAYID